MIRALIVDDCANTRERLTTILEADDEIEVMGEAKDGLEAEEQIYRLRPDVVLLDLVMPRLDGIGLAKKIGSSMRSDVPVMIMISCANGEETISRAFRYGISYYHLKPFDDREILDVVKDVYNDRRWRINMSSSQPSICYEGEVIQQESGCEKKTESEIITRILVSYGMSLKFKGYRYLKRAILLALPKGVEETRVLKEIYYIVAEEFNTNYGNVERNIRYAIEKGFVGKEEKFPKELEALKKRNQRPTNMEFISTVAGYMEKR